MASDPQYSTKHLAGTALRNVFSMGLGTPVGLVQLIYLFCVRRYSLQEILGQNLLRGLYGFAGFKTMMSKEELVREQCRLAPLDTIDLTEDKAVFADRATANHLPVPRELARIQPNGMINSPDGSGDGVDEWMALLRRQIGREVVIKNSLGAYGVGVWLLQILDENLRRHDGSTISGQEFYATLRREQGNATYLVQERLFSHATITSLSGSEALQTLRVVTYVDRVGDVHMPIRKLKLSGHGAIIDNFRGGQSGGALCRLDREGRINQVLVILPGTIYLAETDHLPGRDISPIGFQVPFWDEATALLRDAAIAFQPLPCIGWDVAITPNGPVLIEGNVFWDPLMPQEGSMRQVWHEICERVPPHWFGPAGNQRLSAPRSGETTV
jgi:Sugar-transfer associated ATP-grasp